MPPICSKRNLLTCLAVLIITISLSGQVNATVVSTQTYGSTSNSRHKYSFDSDKKNLTVATFQDNSDQQQQQSDFEPRHKHFWKKKIKKRFNQLTLPLLLAYKLKFFILIPVLIGGLILQKGTTFLAGFFFACFAAALAIKKF